MLAALRLGLGCHFLYEGVWKIKHRDEFSAAPFLTQAKGPVSGLFYGMVPDMYGRERLQRLEMVQVEKVVDEKTGKKAKVDVVRCAWLTDRWDAIRREFVAFYRPGGSASDDQQKAFERLEREAEQKFNKFKEDLEEDYLPSNYKAMQAYYASLDRFENDAENGQSAPFQKERRWKRMMELRQEADGWIKELEGREQALKAALGDLLDENQRDRGPVPATWNPFEWTRMQQINFAVTYGLTAIGLCLILGLATRLAALGGACFMCFVVMTQPAWPTIFPPDLPVVGHALLINKDFIEMLALLTIATTAVGRWGGLDYFVHHLIVEPFFSKVIRKSAPPKG